MRHALRLFYGIFVALSVVLVHAVRKLLDHRAGKHQTVLLVARTSKHRSKPETQNGRQHNSSWFSMDKFGKVHILYVCILLDGNMRYFTFAGAGYLFFSDCIAIVGTVLVLY